MYRREHPRVTALMENIKANVNVYCLSLCIRRLSFNFQVFILKLGSSGFISNFSLKRMIAKTFPFKKKSNPKVGQSKVFLK